MESMENKPLSIRDFLFTLFKRKRIILWMFFLVFLITTAGAYLWPETYKANGKILVKLGREKITTSSMSRSAEQRVMTSLQPRLEDINSEIEILKNHHTVHELATRLGEKFLYPEGKKPTTFFKLVKYHFKKVVGDVKDAIWEVLYTLDLKKRLTPFERMVNDLAKNINAEQVAKTDVIEVTFTWASPEIANHVLKELIDLFLFYHVQVHKTSGEDYIFLKQQVDITGANLRKLEDQYQQFRKKERIVSLPNQGRLLLENHSRLEALLKQTETKIAETQKTVQEFKKKLAGQSKVVQLNSKVDRNPILDKLKIKLLDLELQKRKLESKYLPTSNPIQSIEKEILKVKNRLKQEKSSVTGQVTTGLNDLYNTTEKELIRAEVELVALNEKKGIVSGQLDWYVDELSKLNPHEMELKRLSRLIEIEGENHKFYRKRLEEARVTNLLDSRRVVNLRVIEPPRASSTPVKPKRLMVIGVGLLIGLVGGIGLAFLFEFFDHSLNTATDVDRMLKVPYLASFPENEKWKL